MIGSKSLSAYLDEFESLGLSVPAESARDARREASAISRYIDSWNSEWGRVVSAYANDLPPMGETVRCVVFVPARFEEARLPGLLRAFSEEMKNVREDLQYDVEVLILENWRDGEVRDSTAALVEEWNRSLGPKVAVHHIARSWKRVDNASAITLCRKLLADVALLRAIQRSSYAVPLYLLTEDADTTCTQVGRTSQFISFLDDHPAIDVVCGIEERSRPAMAHNHLLLLDRRCWFFCEMLLSAKSLSAEYRLEADFYWNRIVTPGANACFTAEVYARIGGYSEGLPIFEDMDIGHRISTLRGCWRQGHFVPNVRTIVRLPYREESSAARCILALSRHARDPYDSEESESSFYDYQIEHDIRHRSEFQLLGLIRQFERLTPSNRWRFENVLSSHFSEVRRILNDQELAESLFARVLWLLGFAQGDVRVQDETIGINHCDRFSTYANRFSDLMATPLGYAKYSNVRAVSKNVRDVADLRTQ